MADDRIEELVAKWELSVEAGREIPVEELCRNDPHLLGPVQAKINELKEMGWLDKTESSSRQKPPTPPVENTIFVPGYIIENRYQLNEVIGEGAFGVVWKGHDRNLLRTVALKIPKSSRVPAQNQVDEFREEARKLARLNRPGIVPLFDFIDHAGTCVIVMDYIKGRTLSNYMRGQALSIQEAVELAAALARRVDFAHRHHILHRDIKPANIIIDDHHKLHITDFGVATSLDPYGQASDPECHGTLPFMAPEVLGDSPCVADDRSDIYSIGVVLYFMLTAKLPFTSRYSSPQRLREKILRGDLREPREIRDDIPPEVNDICVKCLARNPYQRYPNALMLNEALQECMLAVKPRRQYPWWNLGSAVAVVVGTPLAMALANKSIPNELTVLWMISMIIAFGLGISLPKGTNDVFKHSSRQSLPDVSKQPINIIEYWPPIDSEPSTPIERIKKNEEPKPISWVCLILIVIAALFMVSLCHPAFHNCYWWEPY